MRESLHNHQKPSNLYIVDVFYIARICGFQPPGKFCGPPPTKSTLKKQPLEHDTYMLVVCRYAMIRYDATSIDVNGLREFLLHNFHDVYIDPKN